MAIISKTNWIPGNTLEYSDITRVENNTIELQTNLQAIGFVIELEEKKTDWSVNDWLSLRNMERIKRNITALRNNFYVYPTTPEIPETPDVENLPFKTIAHTWYMQNIMERIIFDLNRSYITWLNTQAASQMYAGNFYCGEEIIL